MRLALSTLGLPGMPLTRALDLAREHGWEGLELRCAPGETVNLGMTAEERRAAVRAFASGGIVPLTLAGYTGVAAPGPDGPVIAGLRDELRLAADLCALHLRVFPQGGDGPRADADARSVRRLGAVADEAQALGVRILLETHDSHPRGQDVARVLASVGHPWVGALWDALHTYRAEEKPDSSYAALAPHLGYLQVKDVIGLRDLTPLGLGEGVLPLEECVRLLPDRSWVAWEYEAPWYPDAAPLPPLLGRGAAFLAALVHA
ncbi:sugar phosphate isomerase/epimerase [Actinocorallia aurea]